MYDIDTTKRRETGPLHVTGTCARFNTPIFAIASEGFPTNFENLEGSGMRIAGSLESDVKTAAASKQRKRSQAMWGDCGHEVIRIKSTRRDLSVSHRRDACSQ